MFVAEEKQRDGWEKADAFASIASKLLIPVILVVATSLLSRGFQERQAQVSEGGLNRQWVELALSVLQNDAMEDQHEIREWSVAVINHYMPREIQLPSALREGLVDGSVTLPASTNWSISGPAVGRIQTALNGLGLCDRPLIPDGLAGFVTRQCLSRFLGGANDTEVQGLLTTAPELLREWVEAGAAPADWRERAGPALSAQPVVEVMPAEALRPPAPDGTAAPALQPPNLVERIQTALALRGDCAARPDGFPGAQTLGCIADYLGGASTDEARGLLADSPDLLLEWIEAGTAPADWRAQATAPQ